MYFGFVKWHNRLEIQDLSYIGEAKLYSLNMYEIVEGRNSKDGNFLNNFTVSHISLTKTLTVGVQMHL